MKIPLFDHDGTLLKVGSNKLHEQAFYYAISHIFGVTVHISELPFHGMIDNQIIIELAKHHGISEKDALAKLSETTDLMVTYFKEHESECTSKANPGTLELLQILQSHGIHLGVLTGNVEEIGWMKLQAAGLKEYIEFGSFGNMAMKRVDLIEIARQRYNEKFSEKRPITDFVIIGDTPKDIACARDGGIQVIAVATGKPTFDDLANEKPDLLVETLEETDKILDFLNN